MQLLDRKITNPHLYRQLIKLEILDSIRLRSDVLKTSTVLKIINLYNRFFFNNLLDNVSIDIRWNNCFCNWIADCAGSDFKIYIRLSKKLFSSRKITNAMGFKTDHLMTLDILMLVLEHELIHGIMQIFSPRRDQSKRKGVDESHNYYFMRTAQRLFGHTTHVVEFE